VAKPHRRLTAPRQPAHQPAPTFHPLESISAELTRLHVLLRVVVNGLDELGGSRNLIPYDLSPGDLAGLAALALDRVDVLARTVRTAQPA
jgi:hypothetical protein